MKKLIVLALAIIMVGIGFQAHSAGTCTSTTMRISDDCAVFSIDCTGDASNGSFPAVALNMSSYWSWYIVQIDTIPGTTNPTASWDATLKDPNGMDRALDLIKDRSASSPQGLSIATSSMAYPVIKSNLTYQITGNSIASAGIKTEITIKRN